MTGRKTLLGALLLAATIAATTAADDLLPADSSSAGRLAALSPEAAMALADEWGMKAEENRIVSHVTSRAIFFEFPDKVKATVNLPTDRMVVSFAPFIRSTHPCSGHAMSSCRGELTKRDIHVTAVAGDRTILDLETATGPNGFVDLWLPRDLEIDVKIESAGLSATGRISTADGANTCITTFQLRPTAAPAAG